ncbi:M20/M25/M40 family metallo-hydrolase [Spirosoma fluviale]|uniref:Acetylornithine deacetylase/Succinyl-diaminopimelate desuccinylase n=1 Tax=Spirosoma fluviale TaxID=1597977 RepID=A0A286GDG8_9BACT|nr:M20/M25/M40 family metallo-hydrolase [Spirosoma fluviale]SOD93064.1 Acetylornithine deacetylase/Succinyl-diaminopimelate desuccinylase [Spirosoma fluviale]
MKKVVPTCFIGLLTVFLFPVHNTQAQDLEPGKVANVQVQYTKEIDQLAKNKQIQKAFQFIVAQNKRNRDELIKLTEIPAPPFLEEKRGVEFAAMLKEAGADSVWTDKVGNVLALRKGKQSKRTVALDGHLDTVFPAETDVRVKAKGDTLFAPGIGDDTRGLVAVVAVLRALEDANIETQSDVLFIGSVGEEGLGDLRGVKHLFSNQSRRIDSWISIEAGAMGRASNMGLGSNRYRITFKGPGGHSWGAFGLANPQHALGSAIHYFSKAADKFTRTGARTSFNVGRIGGGTSVNSIPFSSWMEVDMRSEIPENLVLIDSLLKSSVQKALEEHNQMRRSGPALTVDFERIGERPSGELPETLPLVQRSMAAIAHFGESPKIGRGSTNGNIPISKGIPAVTIGQGGLTGGTLSMSGGLIRMLIRRFRPRC